MYTDYIQAQWLIDNDHFYMVSHVVFKISYKF